MPFITVEGPKFRDSAAKREYLKKLTELTAQSYGMANDTVVVLLKEMGGPHMFDSPQSIASGGKLLKE